MTIPNSRTLLRSIALRLAPLAAADALCVIAFAAGFAMAINESDRGVLAVAPWAMLAGLALLARGLVERWVLRVTARRASEAKAGIRVALLERLFAAPAPGLSAARQVSLAVEETDAIDGFLLRFAPAQVSSAIIPLLLVLAAAAANLPAAGIILATIAPFVLFMIVAGRTTAAASRRHLDALSRLTGLFADRVRGLPLILAYESGRSETRRIKAATREVADRTLDILRLAFVSSAGLEFFAALAVALLAVYAGFSLLGVLPFSLPRGIAMREAFFVLALAPEVYAPFRRAAAAYHEREIAVAALDRLSAAALRETPAPLPLQGPPVLVFNEAVVAPFGAPDLSLGPVTGRAAPGGLTVIAGPSGAGKSTLLAAMVGEALLTGGEILIDGAVLGPSGLDPAGVGWAGQTPLILSGSVADNLRLGIPDATGERLVEAAAATGLLASLEGRPGLLDARLDERGGGLSGGERMRLGLTRVVAGSAALWLLDEPTAGLDAESEASIIRLLLKEADSRTILVASQSEALIARASSVIRL